MGFEYFERRKLTSIFSATRFQGEDNSAATFRIEENGQTNYITMGFLEEEEYDFIAPAA